MALTADRVAALWEQARGRSLSTKQREQFRISRDVFEVRQYSEKAILSAFGERAKVAEALALLRREDPRVSVRPLRPALRRPRGRGPRPDLGDPGRRQARQLEAVSRSGRDASLSRPP